MPSKNPLGYNYGYNKYYGNDDADSFLKEYMWEDEYKNLSQRCKDRMYVVMNDFANIKIDRNRVIARIRLECYKAVPDSFSGDRVAEAEKLLQYVMQDYNP